MTMRVPFRVMAFAILIAAIVGLPTSPASAASRNGCSYSAPTPSISSSGKASFKISLNCGPKTGGITDRQVVFDLMGDDPVGDDVMNWSRFNTRSERSYSVSFSNWPCNEDRPGGDEIYVRVRIEGYSPGAGAWIKGPWLNGSVRKGTCT